MSCTRVEGSEPGFPTSRTPFPGCLRCEFPGTPSNLSCHVVPAAQGPSFEEMFWLGAGKSTPGRGEKRNGQRDSREPGQCKQWPCLALCTPQVSIKEMFFLHSCWAFQSGSGFFNLDAVDVWGRILCCRDCPVHVRYSAAFLVVTTHGCPRMAPDIPLQNVS